VVIVFIVIMMIIVSIMIVIVAFTVTSRSRKNLQYIVDAMNEKWVRDPQELQTHPEPTGNGKPLGGERS
jgi:hypothetical protein